MEDIDDILKKTAEDYEAWKQNMTNEVSGTSTAFPLNLLAEVGFDYEPLLLLRENFPYLAENRCSYDYCAVRG